jgi:hypothetical protein
MAHPRANKAVASARVKNDKVDATIANPLGFSKSLGASQPAPAGRPAAACYSTGRPAQGPPEPHLEPEAPAPDAMSGLLREEAAALAPQADGLRLEHRCWCQQRGEADRIIMSIDSKRR